MDDLIERADLRRPVALKLAVLVLADVARHCACRLDHVAESAGLHGIGSQFMDHDAPPYFLVAGSEVLSGGFKTRKRLRLRPRSNVRAPMLIAKTSLD